MEEYSKMKQNIESVFSHLLEKHNSVVEQTCKKLNFAQQDLQEGDRASLSSRAGNQQERRLAKMMKVLADVVPKVELDPQVYMTANQLRLPERKSPRPQASLSPIYVNHQEYMKISYQKEKQKKSRNLKVLKNIKRKNKELEMKAEAVKKRQAEKQKKIQEQKAKRKEALQQKIQQRKIQRENWVIQKKKKQQNIQRERRELEKKVNEKFRKEHKKSNKPPKKTIQNSSYYQTQQDDIDDYFNDFQYTMKIRNDQNTSTINQRANTARVHSVKVNQTFSFAKRQQARRTQNRLLKCIQKSVKTNKALNTKEIKSKTVADRVKQSLENSFDRQIRGLNKRQSDIQNRLKQIEIKKFSKQSLFRKYHQDHEKELQQRKKINLERRENHARNLSEEIGQNLVLKEKVMKKHERLEAVNAELKAFKEDLSQRKRNTNLEVRMVMSVQSSPNKK